MHADQGIDARHGVKESLTVALDEAACHHDATAGTFPLAFDRLGYGFEGLGPGSLEKPAGVDDDDIRVGFVGGDECAGLGELPEHLLGIHQVLGASQRHESHFDRLAHRRSLLATLSPAAACPLWLGGRPLRQNTIQGCHTQRVHHERRMRRKTANSIPPSSTIARVAGIRQPEDTTRVRFTLTLHEPFFSIPARSGVASRPDVRISWTLPEASPPQARLVHPGQTAPPRVFFCADGAYNARRSRVSVHESRPCLI